MDALLMVFVVVVAHLQKYVASFSHPSSFNTVISCFKSHRNLHTRKTSTSAQANKIYDDWSSDAVASLDTLHLDDENVLMCLDEFVMSEYGERMFGCHDLTASHGITGEIDLVEIRGPEVVLTLRGKFWHKRETVLGRAAIWLNARIPEIASICVDDPRDLDDFEDVHDEATGSFLYREDKRAPDFNGDRETMEYQGIDPDQRGPFPPGVGGFRAGGSMINPA